MAETQNKAAGVDQNGNPIPMVGGEFGDIITLVLTVANADSTVKLSSAADYPKNPTVISWVLQNFNTIAGDDFFVSGSEVVAGQGLLLAKGGVGPNGVPGTLSLMTDPGKTFIRQDSGGPLNLQLTLFGKNLR